MRSDDKLVVEINDYEQTLDDKPIVYTYDAKDFIAVLVHIDSSSILLSIDEANNEINTFTLQEILRVVKGSVNNVEIFINKNSKKKNVSILQDILVNQNIQYNIYNLFEQDGIESIGYDISENKYYGVLFNSTGVSLEEYNFKEVKKMQ